MTCWHYSNEDGFNKGNDREWKGRKREERLRQSQKDVATENYGDKGFKKESKFLAQVGEYGCELRFGNEGREIKLRTYFWNDSKTFI